LPQALLDNFIQSLYKTLYEVHHIGGRAMKPSDLVTLWNAPDNTRLTAKQYTIRLPIRVAAQISALCDLYPRKNRTELIGDLLASALDAVGEALPSTEGHPFDTPEGTMYEAVGPWAEFPKLTDKYIAELEAELSASGEAVPAPPSKRTGGGSTRRRTRRGKTRWWTRST
jgi:hypothetical protein